MSARLMILSILTAGSAAQAAPTLELREPLRESTPTAVKADPALLREPVVTETPGLETSKADILKRLPKGLFSRDLVAMTIAEKLQEPNTKDAAVIIKDYLNEASIEDAQTVARQILSADGLAFNKIANKLTEQQRAVQRLNDQELRRLNNLNIPDREALIAKFRTLLSNRETEHLAIRLIRDLQYGPTNTSSARFAHLILNAETTKDLTQLADKEKAERAHYNSLLANRWPGFSMEGIEYREFPYFDNTAKFSIAINIDGSPQSSAATLTTINEMRASAEASGLRFEYSSKSDNAKVQRTAFGIQLPFLKKQVNQKSIVVDVKGKIRPVLEFASKFTSNPVFLARLQSDDLDGIREDSPVVPGRAVDIAGVGTITDLKDNSSRFFRRIEIADSDDLPSSDSVLLLKEMAKASGVEFRVQLEERAPGMWRKDQYGTVVDSTARKYESLIIQAVGKKDAVMAFAAKLGQLGL